LIFSGNTLRGFHCFSLVIVSPLRNSFFAGLLNNFFCRQHCVCQCCYKCLTHCFGSYLFHCISFMIFLNLELFFCLQPILKHSLGGQKIFQKSRSCLKILGIRMVTSRQYHSEDPQFWSDLSTSLLSVAFFLVLVNWYTFLYVRKKRWIDYVENMKKHSLKFSHLDNSNPEFVHPLYSLLSQKCIKNKPWSN
jgi:hypothetical protein